MVANPPINYVYVPLAIGVEEVYEFYSKWSPAPRQGRLIVSCGVVSVRSPMVKRASL